MNMPSSLPSSLTDPLPGLPNRLGSLARNAAPTLGAYFNIIRARKWFVLGLTAAIILLAWVVVNLMTPIYRAGATILIEDTKNKVISFQEMVGAPGGREHLQTQAEFMKSREVGSRVLNALDLWRHKLFDPRQAEPGKVGAWLSQFAGFLNLSGGLDGRPYTDEEVEEIALARYKANLDVVPIRLSQLVEIRFESADPFLAAQVANQTAESYITADLDARFDQQKLASKWLNERLDSLRAELEQSDKALQSYRESIGLISTPDSSMGGNIKKLDTSSERLIIARIERAQAEQIYNQVRRGAANRYEVPLVFNNPAVSAARAIEAAAEKKVADAAQALGPAHPEYRAAVTELTSARENVRRQSEGVISSIAKEYEVARSTEKALESEVASSRGDIQDINRKEGQLNVLERNVATNQQIYQAFLAKVKETDATSDFQSPVARVVDRAVAPLEPVKPPKLQIALLSAILGLMLSAMIAIAREQKSAVIRSTDEVLEKLGVPLIVAAPKVEGKHLAGLPRIQHDEPQSLFAESVRSALTGVRLSLLDVAKPIVAFTSTLPGEGKSTLALNFAIEQARSRRTLLIDADMRKPSIAGMLKITGERKGLTELFQGAPPEDCICQALDLNLSLVLSGARVKNPHDLLMSPHFGEILHQLKTKFDLIVIDTPPLELVSDALPIGLHCTGVIYVVKSSETLIPMARRGLERLASANVRTFGVVLNAHDFARAGQYYGEYSAYGVYGKGYYGNAGTNT